MPNSFLHPVDEVHWDAYVPGDVAEALRVTRGIALQRIDAVLAIPDAERTFDNTVLAIERATAEFNAVSARVWHLVSVTPDWEEASVLATAEAVELGTQIAFSRPLYDAMKVVADAPAAQQLPANQRKLLTELVADLERQGVASPPAVQAELRDTRARLGELRAKFNGNLIESAKVAGIAVADATELAGLPAAMVERFRAAAAGKGLDGYWIAYSQPVYARVMSSCADATTRQRMYAEHCQLAAEANGPVMTEILRLRREQAVLLGFADFTDLATVDRMAKTGQRVADFIDELAGHYRPLAEQENAALLDYARKRENDPGLELTAADIDAGVNFFYAARRYGDLIGVDAAVLGEYLPLEQVKDAAFAVAESLYGVRVRQVDEPSWHPDVEVFEIRDETGRHLATLHADWLARPDKQGGARKTSIYIPPRGAADNGKPYIGNVLCNFAPAEPGEPVLCTLRDATTLMHEGLGHFFHSALSNTTLPEQAGTQVQWDFVEAPAKLMENWFWQPEVFGRMARHWRTGEPLPTEIQEKLLESRSYRAGAFHMRQLYLAAIDLELHRDFTGGDIYEFVRNIKQRFMPDGVPVFADDQMLASFTHIFAGSYAAGYYTYEWSDQIQADMFGWFQEQGPLSREAGRTYVDTVIGRGGEAEPAQLVEALLGRPVTAAAKLNRDGVLSARPAALPSASPVTVPGSPPTAVVRDRRVAPASASPRDLR